MLSLSCWINAAVVVLTSFVPACTLDQSEARVTMSEIIDNVRRNESLYEEIEVLLRESFVSHAHASFPDGRQATTREEKDLRYVNQNGMFRFERKGTTTLSGKSQMPNDSIRAFDGKTTRLFDQGTLGNVIAGRSDDADFIRPHMMLLRKPSWLMVPLSTFMQGHKAMAAHPYIEWEGSLVMENTYQGEAEFHGLKCHKVWLSTINQDRGVVNDRWELWLAEERNYLPVRMFGYLFRWSNDIPVGEGTADDLREIAPGIWFPFAARTVRYDSAVIQQEKRQKERWHEEYVAEKVSLNPKYERSFFGDVRFPDGTPVYEIENKQIVRSYLQGTPGTPAGPSSPSWFRRWWFLWTSVAVLVAVACLLVVRKVNSTGR